MDPDLPFRLDRGADASSGDLGIDAAAIPKQTCTAGLASTHLAGPTTTLAGTLGAAPASGALSTLRLASGDRRIARGRIDPRLKRCVAAGGCVAIGLLERDSPEIRGSLARRGLRLVEHLSGRHHVIALSPGADIEGAVSGGGIEAMTVLEPRDKLPAPAPGGAVMSRRDEGRVAYLADAAGKIRRVSFESLGLPSSRAGELAAARNAWVFRIGARRSPGGPLDEDSRRSIRTEVVQKIDLTTSPPTYAGYSGAGIVVSVLDTGVDPKHLDLHVFGAGGKDLGSRVVQHSTNIDSHGTAVASVIAGNGHNSAAYTHDGEASTPYQWRGHAPRVKSILSILSSRLDLLLTAIADKGSNLSNHSYVLSYGNYSAVARDVDAAIHEGVKVSGKRHPPRPMIWAIGNQGLSPQYGSLRGYYSCYAVAKNPICVGGSNANDDEFSPLGALGPTFDGRIKPDVVAPSRKDYRPPAGVATEIDTIRLVAKAGSGAQDVTWGFDTNGDLDQWKLEAGIGQVKVAGGILGVLIHDGGAGGVKMTRGGLTIDAAKYDQLEIRMRLTLKTVPGTYSWPRFWVVGWDNDADSAIDHNIYPVFTAAKKDGGWQIHTAKLPAAKFKGTVTTLQLRPVVYDDRIVVAKPNGQSYRGFTGTSLAAPAVSGVVALLLEQFAKLGADLSKDPPWPSTIKAALIHGARDLVHTVADPRDRNNPDTKAPNIYHRGPDFVSGYGLVDASASRDLIDANRPGAIKLRQATFKTKEIHRYRVAVGTGITFKALKATLVWDDAPGNPTLAIDQPQLVNDLDLVAVSPSGKVHGPWVLDPLPLDKATYAKGYDPIKPADVKPARRCTSAAPWQDKKCEDHLNNVEQVVVDAPETGWWTITVRAHLLPKGPQHYTLTVSGSCS